MKIKKWKRRVLKLTLIIIGLVVYAEFIDSFGFSEVVNFLLGGLYGLVAVTYYNITELK